MGSLSASRLFGFCDCSVFKCSGFSVRVVRENLWKRCGKTCGKVGGESCGKNVDKLAAGSFSHKIERVYTFWAELWESFARGFTHKITGMRVGFYTFST